MKKEIVRIFRLFMIKTKNEKIIKKYFKVVLTNKISGVIIMTTKELKKRKGGSIPMDNTESISQYVSGMANEEARDESLYHR